MRIILLLVFSILLIHSNAQTWNGSVSNVWTNPLNWTPNAVPGAGASVVINPAPNNPKLPANTTLGALSTTSGASLDFNGFTLSVGNNFAYNNLTGTTFLNTNVSTDMVFNITTPSGGYNFQMSGCTFSDHVTINLGGTDLFLEAQTSANTYNGNVTYNIIGSLTTNFGVNGASQFNGNFNVNRTVAGTTSLFGTGGLVTGNFNYQNTVGGQTGFGNSTITSTINGTCTINAVYPTPNSFALFRVKNLTSGGTINVQNSIAPNIQNDTLKVTSFTIQGYEGSAYAYFLYNKIDGNVTLEDDVAFISGYSTELRNNTFTGTTSFTLKGTNHVYESNTTATGSVYNGNTVFNLAGPGALYFSNGDTSTFNGNLTISRTVGGYIAAFGSGSIINGNFTYNNTSSGDNDLGNVNVKTVISGTVNMNVNLTAVDRFALHRLVNQTAGGKINVKNSRGFDVQRDSLKVDSLNILYYRGSAYGFLYDNQIIGHVTLTDSTNAGGGWNTFIKNNSITGNTHFKILGANNFYEAHTSANTYTGNFLMDIFGIGDIYTCHNAKSTITGNYTVNRTGAGYTALFSNAVTIGGNFSYTKNSAGASDIGNIGVKSTIAGIINMNVTQNLSSTFSLYRVQNSTNGGSISVTNIRGFDIQQDSFLVSALSINNYGDGAYAYLYNNQITGNATLSVAPGSTGGWNTFVRNNTLTGNTIFNMNGTNDFFEGHTVANTYNGNLTFNVAGSGSLYTSYNAKSIINGNYTVNRTVAGYTRLFGNGATISGNFTYTKNANGASDLGTLSSKTSIGGTININVTQSTADPFSLLRVQNLTNGGSVMVNNSQAPNIQQDSLIVISFNLNGYAGSAYLYFFNNQISGNVTLTDAASYTGGYSIQVANNTINGNTIFNSNGTNDTYEALNGANTYNGNLTFNVAGSGTLNTSYNSKSIINGNYTVNRTAVGATNLFSGAATISGNFSYTKNANGASSLGVISSKTSIGGTIHINVTQSFADAFVMYRIQNLTDGGSVTINTPRGFDIQQDSLILSSFSINDYAGSAYGYFYNNQIQGALNLSNNVVYGGGYSTHLRNNTISGTTNFSNVGSNTFNDGDVANSGNSYLGNVTYTRTGGVINVGTSDTNNYAGNLTFNNAAALPITAEFIRFTGSTNTTIDQLGTGPVIIQKPILNKSASAAVTLNKPVIVSFSFTFVIGYLSSTATNPLVLLDNINHSGASNSSHVIGCVTRVGNDAFTFPLGNGIGYHPLAITAPTAATDSFQACIILKHPDVDGYNVTSKEVALLQIAPYHYWTLNQISGTNSEAVSLGWSIPCANTIIGSLPGMAVARWNGTQWNNLGNLSTTGNTALGTVTQSGTTANYGVFALATTSASNSWQITSVTASASTVCAGTSTTLTGAGAANYNCMPGNLSGTSVVVTPLTTTTYTITGTSATGCVTTATKTITVNPVPTPNAGTDRTHTCITPSSTVGTAGVAGTTYAWLPTSGLTASNINQPVANPTATTTYTVTATITATGCTASDAVVVTVNKTPPVANAGADKTNNCITPSQTIGTTAVGGNTYAWSPAIGLSATNIAQPIANPTATTTYTVTATNTVNGCTATDAVLVTVNKTAPTANAGADVTNNCITPSQTIGTAAVAGNTYAWAPSAGISATNIAQPTANPTSTTTYTVTVTTTANGCTATDAVLVSVNKTAPAANAGADIANTCTTPSQTIGTAAVAGNTYVWAPSAGLSATNIALPTANPTSTTIYTVTVTTTANGCTATDAVLVSVNKTAPAANAGADIANTCITPSQVIGTTSVAGNTYAWSPSAGLSATNIALPTANPTSTTTYTVTVTTTANGCTATDAVLVSINKTAPNANAGADVTNTCTTPSQVIGTTSVAGNTYAWSPSGGLSATNIAQPTANPTSTTTYTVTVTTTANGCTATDAVIVSVNKTLPTANAGTDKTLTCTTPSSSIGTAAVGGNTYSWLPVTALSAANIAVPTTTATATTTYTVTVTTTANGCTATDAVLVTVNKTPPTVGTTATATSIACGASTSITGTGAATYAWQPGSLSGTNITVSPTATTTYTVTGIAANGCTATAIRLITVAPCASILNVNVFIEGYYLGGGLMRAALLNSGVAGANSTQSDTITVELHNATAPYALVASQKRILNTNGTSTGSFAVSGTYYIVIKHRNAVETWSASPVSISGTTTYTFSNLASKAFANNQVLVSPGVFALYSGDINQDFSVDAFDFVLLDPDLVLGASGYLATDINGDGSVDAFDYVILDINIITGVTSFAP